MKKFFLLVLVLVFAACHKDNTQTGSFFNANGQSVIVTGNDLSNGAIITPVTTNEGNGYHFGIGSNGNYLNFRYGASHLPIGSTYRITANQIQSEYQLVLGYANVNGTHYAVQSPIDYIDVLIVDNSNSGVCVEFNGALSDINGNILYINGAFENVHI
jgi:hypothetical protein